MSLPLSGLLRGFPDQAFTVDEVQQMLSQTTARQASLEDIITALDSLTSRGTVQIKEIDGREWYTIPRRRLGFRKE